MAVLLVIVAAIFLPLAIGCGGDGDDGQIDTVDSAETTPSETTAADEFFQAVGRPAAQTSPTGSLLDDPALAELARTAQANQSIAQELSGLAQSYDVTPAEVAEIEDTACNSGITAAMTSIRSEIPGADLRALPALNRLVTEVAQNCGANDPDWVDRLSATIFEFLISNTNLLPDSLETEATPLMRTVYKAGCKAIQAGVVGGIKRIFDHRGPAYGLSLAVGSAMTTCPERLRGAFGNELESLIGR